MYCVYYAVDLLSISSRQNVILTDGLIFVGLNSYGV